MPTYEYKCDACEKTFEKFQSITAEPIRKCPHCNKQKARRLIGTGAGLIFKGSGFYITDYRSDSYKKSAQSESPSTTSTASGNGKESKPAASGASSSSVSTPAPAPSGGRSSSTTPAASGGSKK